MQRAASSVAAVAAGAAAARRTAAPAAARGAAAAAAAATSRGSATAAAAVAASLAASRGSAPAAAAAAAAPSAAAVAAAASAYARAAAAQQQGAASVHSPRGLFTFASSSSSSSSAARPTAAAAAAGAGGSGGDADEEAAAEVTLVAGGSRYLATLGDEVFSISGETTVDAFLEEVGKGDVLLGVGAKKGSAPRLRGPVPMADAVTSGCVVQLSNGDRFQLGPAAPLTVAGAVGGTPYVPAGFTPMTREKMEELKAEFIPLFKKKRELDNAAEKRASLILWGGLGAMSAQWVFLARLTWWEFNWDVMEPVTYFIMTGTGVLAYVYFMIQKAEYTYDHLRGVVLSKRIYKNYVRNDFPIDKYFALEDQIHKADPSLLKEIEYELEQEEFEIKMGVSHA